MITNRLCQFERNELQPFLAIFVPLDYLGRRHAGEGQRDSWACTRGGLEPGFDYGFLYVRRRRLQQPLLYTRLPEDCRGQLSQVPRQERPGNLEEFQHQRGMNISLFSQFISWGLNFIHSVLTRTSALMRKSDLATCLGSAHLRLTEILSSTLRMAVLP